jgi:hypothetical protein
LIAITTVSFFPFLLVRTIIIAIGGSGRTTTWRWFQSLTRVPVTPPTFVVRRFVNQQRNWSFEGEGRLLVPVAHEKTCRVAMAAACTRHRTRRRR